MSKKMYLKTAIDISLLFLFITTIINIVSGLATGFSFHSSDIKLVFGLDTPWFFTSLVIILVLFIASKTLKAEKNNDPMKFLITSLLLITNGIISIASNSFKLENLLYYFSHPGNELIDRNSALFYIESLLLIIIQIVIGISMCAYSLKKLHPADSTEQSEKEPTIQ